MENRLCGTDIRLGVIGESGTSGQFDEVERRALVAATRVATTTGLPVNIQAHRPAKAVTLDILGALSAVGLDLPPVYLSHLAEIDAVEYLVAVLETGPTLYRADDAQVPRFLPSTRPTDRQIAGGETALHLDLNALL